MAASLEPGPEAAFEVIADALRALPPQDQGAAVSDAVAYAGVPTYGATLSALTQLSSDGGLDIDILIRTGWRHLVDEGGKESLVDVADAGDVLKVVAVNRGAAAEEFADATMIAERLADGLPDSAVRAVDLPVVGMKALWLSTGNVALDVVIDVSTLQGPVKLAAFLSEANRRARLVA